MLQLNKTDISLQRQSDNAQSAIHSLAADLSSKKYVDEKYVNGMLAREKQNTTYLGNGIAIPHGTTDTRDLVKQTGLVVHHYPNGVDWGEGNIAYLAIGIAAKSDEHLEILKQLTKVLSQDGTQDALKNAATADEIIAIVSGNAQINCELNESLILTDFPATDLLQLSAVGAGLLKNAEFVDNQFVAEVISKTPTNLGNGLWLVNSGLGVNRTALSIVTPSHEASFDNKPVSALITIAANNFSHKNQLEVLTKLISEQQQHKITSGSKQEILNLFAQENTDSTIAEDGLSATYKIKNAHGLHARPGACW